LPGKHALSYYEPVAGGLLVARMFLKADSHRTSHTDRLTKIVATMKCHAIRICIQREGRGTFFTIKIPGYYRFESIFPCTKLASMEVPVTGFRASQGFCSIIGFLSDFEELLSKKEFLRDMQFFS
jgi:hypothetical protein